MELHVETTKQAADPQCSTECKFPYVKWHQWMNVCGTRNTFCRTRSLSNATFFIFDHVTFVQFKICCCVQNFIEIGWFFFAEIWRYNDFQNGGRPPSWNCFTTIRDHPRSLCCWPQLPVKFHVNLIYRSEDIAIRIFRIFGLNNNK